MRTIAAMDRLDISVTDDMVILTQITTSYSVKCVEIPLILLDYIWDQIRLEIRLADAEVSFFDDVVSGTIARRDEIDALLEERLASGWSLKRLDRTMLQILRAGAYELLARADVPAASAISEYVDVAHAFFDAREAKFVNGLLDAVAKTVR